MVDYKFLLTHASDMKVTKPYQVEQMVSYTPVSSSPTSSSPGVESARKFSRS